MKCKSDGCTEDAAMEVFWPGQTTQSCLTHYEGQQRIAGAMGFPLDARPLPPEEAKES